MSARQELSPESLADVLEITSPQLSRSADKVVYTTSPSTQAGDHRLSQIHLATPGQEDSSKPLTSGLFNDKLPRFSPHDDDSTIAFISDRAKPGESSAIYLLSTTGPGEPYPITPTANKAEINTFEWSPCGQFIAYLSADEKTPERERKDKEKDDAQVFGEEWPFQRLRLVHIVTKDVKTLVCGERHVSDFVWTGSGDDGKRLVYLTTRTPEIESGVHHDTEFATVDLTTGATEQVYTFPGPIVMAPIVEKDGAVYFVAGTEPKSCCTSSMAYRVDLEAETVRYEQHVERGEWCYSDIRGGGSNVVSVVVRRGLKDEVAVLDGDNTSTIYSGMHNIEQWAVAATENGHTVVLVKSDINTPFELYSVSPTSSKDSTPKPIQLSSHHKSLLSSPIGTFTPVYTTASDGTPIDGILTIPDPAPSSPIPFILDIHGGPYSRSTVSFPSENSRYWIPHLVSAGYAVLQPNYRGGSGHGEEYAAASKGGMGGKDYGDVMTLTRHVLNEHEEFDKGKVAVCGWSQGGFLSYVSTVRGVKAAAEEALRNYSAGDDDDGDEEQPDRPFHFRAAICGAGVTDWDMIAMTSDLPFFESEFGGTAPWASDKSSVKARHGSAIWEMKEAAQTLDAAVAAAAAASKSGKDKTKVKTLKKEDMMTPVLILHGENDERVPVTQAIAFRRGAQWHGWPCEMVVYPREPHDVGERVHILDMLRRVRRFLDVQLR